MQNKIDERIRNLGFFQKTLVRPEFGFGFDFVSEVIDNNGCDSSGISFIAVGDESSKSLSKR